MDTEIWDTITIYGYKININSEIDKNYDNDGLNDYEKVYHEFLVTIQDFQDKYFNQNEGDDEVGSNKFSLEIIMPTVDNTYEMGNGDIAIENQCIVVIGIKNPTGNLKELAEKHNNLLGMFASKKEIFQNYKIDSDPEFYSGIPWVVSLDIGSQDSPSISDDDDSSYDNSDYSDEETETSAEDSYYSSDSSAEES